MNTRRFRLANWEKGFYKNAYVEYKENCDPNDFGIVVYGDGVREKCTNGFWKYKIVLGRLNAKDPFDPIEEIFPPDPSKEYLLTMDDIFY